LFLKETSLHGTRETKPRVESRGVARVRILHGRHRRKDTEGF